MSTEVRARINEALTQASVIFGQDNLLDAIMAR